MSFCKLRRFNGEGTWFLLRVGDSQALVQEMRTSGISGRPRTGSSNASGSYIIKLSKSMCENPSKESCLQGLIQNGIVPTPSVEWDAGEMGCGELVIELWFRLKEMSTGETIQVTARDPGAPEDMPAWCRLTGHRLLWQQHPVYIIQRKEN